MVETLRFLADGNRLRILGILSRQESCVCELIEQTGLTQPLVSYHLRDAGLVRRRRKAQWVYYSIEPDADVLVFGHTHKPWVREIEGVLFVNDGSVGKPKDGDSRAAWALLTVEPDQPVTAFRRHSPATAHQRGAVRFARP